jgi:hypothetical protein
MSNLFNVVTCGAGLARLVELAEIQSAPWRWLIKAKRQS